MNLSIVEDDQINQLNDQYYSAGVWAHESEISFRKSDGQEVSSNSPSQHITCLHTNEANTHASPAAALIQGAI